MNADISILDKSVIPGLPFCVFAGRGMLTYANDSLTCWLSDRIKIINWLWKAFSWLGISNTTENAQKSILDFTDFCYLPPFQSKVVNFFSMWMTFNHLKTNSTKLAHYRLKFERLLSFLTFNPWCKIPLESLYSGHLQIVDTFSRPQWCPL